MIWKHGRRNKNTQTIKYQAFKKAKQTSGLFQYLLGGSTTNVMKGPCLGKLLSLHDLGSSLHVFWGVELCNYCMSACCTWSLLLDIACLFPSFRRAFVWTTTRLCICSDFIYVSKSHYHLLAGILQFWTNQNGKPCECQKKCSMQSNITIKQNHHDYYNHCATDAVKTPPLAPVNFINQSTKTSPSEMFWGQGPQTSGDHWNCLINPPYQHPPVGVFNGAF